MRILRLLARLFGYSVAAALITGLGMIVFLWVRYTPRARLPASMEIANLSPDGGLLLGRVGGIDWYFRRKPVRHPDEGTFQVWNTREGKLERSIPSAQVRPPKFNRAGFSWNPILIVDNEGVPSVINWITGKEQRLDHRECKDLDPVVLSPQNRWLVAQAKQGRRFLLDSTSERGPVPLEPSFSKFSPDDSLLLFRERESLLIRQIKTGIQRAIPISQYDMFAVAPNSQWMALARGSEPPQLAEARGILADWFMGTGTRRLEFRTLPEGGVAGGVELPALGLWMTAIAPDSRRGAIWRMDSGGDLNLVLVEIPSGRTIGQIAVEPLQLATFSPNGQLMLCQAKPDRQYMFDAATGKRLWEKATAAWLTFYGQGSDMVFQEDHDQQYQLLDGPTGAVRFTLPPDFPTANHLPSFTPDGRRLVIRGWRQLQREPHFWEAWLTKWLPSVFADNVPGVIVVDSSTGEEVFRLLNRAQLGEGRYLSDDGETLVTFDGDENDPEGATISIWDVSPRRAWYWALAAAAATVLFVSIARAFWTKWRKCKSQGCPTRAGPDGAGSR
jgi:hypothetical protein